MKGDESEKEEELKLKKRHWGIKVAAEIYAPT